MDKITPATMNNNFRFPEVVQEMRAYWLAGQTGGQILCGDYGYAPVLMEDGDALLESEFKRVGFPKTMWLFIQSYGHDCNNTSRQ